MKMLQRVVWVFLLLLPLTMMSQSVKTNISILILDARVTFIQPENKEAAVYLRKTSKDKWTLWQIVPKNPIPADQAVVLSLPQPIVATTQCQVIFQ